MYFQRVKHTLPGDDNLLGSFLWRQCSNQCSNLLSSLPLSQLAESLLPSPDTGVNNFQEQQACPWVEDENSSIDRFGGEVTLECLMDGNSIYIGVIDKPDGLIHEQISIVLGVEIGLSRLRRVQLQAFPDSLPEHIYSRISLHDFVDCLQDQCPYSWEIISESGVHVVGQIHCDQAASGRRIYGYAICGVVKELGSGVSLNIMGVVVAPPQLHINPKFIRHCAIVLLLVLVQKARLAYLPLERSEQDDIGAG